MDYRYQPKPKNKNITYLTLLLAAVSFLFLLLGMQDVLGVRSLWHLLLLLALVATLFFYLRYIATSYCYVISEGEGEPLLTVLHVQGRRISTHCRLGLAHLSSLVEVPDEDTEQGRRALSAFRAEGVRYSYRATLGRAPSQILYGIEGGRRFAIRIEGDDAFVAYLRAVCERAAAYASEEVADSDE
ncbi:MAG: hypothetical protein J6T24_02840 [Clostridia bacterium]|nr:hypothetical protein [Clostridia bacterium]